MMRILGFAFFMLIAIIALIFSLRNFQLISIDLYFINIQMPLVVALSIGLFIGIFIGFLIAFMRIIKLKSEYKLLDRKVRNTLSQDSQ